MLVRDHANHFHPLRFGRARPNQNAFPDCALSVKSFVCQRVVNHDYIPPRQVVIPGKKAASQQAHAHGFEVTGKHDFGVGCLKLTGIR